MFGLIVIVRSSGSGSGMLRWEKEPFVIIPGKNRKGPLLSISKKEKIVSLILAGQSCRFEDCA